MVLLLYPITTFGSRAASLGRVPYVQLIVKSHDTLCCTAQIHVCGAAAWEYKRGKSRRAKVTERDNNVMDLGYCNGETDVAAAENQRRQVETRTRLYEYLLACSSLASLSSCLRPVFIDPKKIKEMQKSLSKAWDQNAKLRADN